MLKNSERSKHFVVFFGYFCGHNNYKSYNNVRHTSESSSKRTRLYVLLALLAIVIAIGAFAYTTCSKAVTAERHVRYAGIMNIASEKLAKTIRGMEMNAMNEFDEVEKHLDSPDAVIAALESKTDLNHEVRGYFAAFEPDYFPQKGKWFEPYVHHVDSNAFEVRLVGNARHNYFKSPWYIRAKQSSESFWSEPYYYYDGTNISGHYTTFVKPIFDKTGRLACVCGADLTFEWLTKELQRIDVDIKNNELLNSHLFGSDCDFYSVVLNKDGTSVAFPEDKKVTITEDFVIRDLERGKAGTIDMTVNGVPSTVYYGPIEHVDWSIAIVVAK